MGKMLTAGETGTSYQDLPSISATTNDTWQARRALFYEPGRIDVSGDDTKDTRNSRNRGIKILAVRRCAIDQGIPHYSISCSSVSYTHLTLPTKALV